MIILPNYQTQKQFTHRPILTYIANDAINHS